MGMNMIISLTGSHNQKNNPQQRRLHLLIVKENRLEKSDLRIYVKFLTTILNKRTNSVHQPTKAFLIKPQTCNMVPHT
jgi:hypothetical protein